MTASTLPDSERYPQVEVWNASGEFVRAAYTLRKDDDAHNCDEEKEHAAMLLEWIRRQHSSLGRNAGWVRAYTTRCPWPLQKGPVSRIPSFNDVGKKEGKTERDL